MEQIEIMEENPIHQRFGKAAHTYHQDAEIQKKVAEGLMASLRPWKGILPQGPILEVGAGTGFLSEMILDEFPDRKVAITDASREMVLFAHEDLYDRGVEIDHAMFMPFDVDRDELGEGEYSLIITSFAAQWFKDTALGFSKLARALKPGGLLLAAFPGNKSFPEWYEACLETGLPFTANALPDTEEVVIKLSMDPVQVDFYENTLTQTFESSKEFFQHLKDIGAASSKSGKSLSAKQLKILMNHWDSKSEKVNISWHTVYLVAKKED